MTYTLWRRGADYVAPSWRGTLRRGSEGYRCGHLGHQTVSAADACADEALRAVSVTGKLPASWHSWTGRAGA